MVALPTVKKVKEIKGEVRYYAGLYKRWLDNLDIGKPFSLLGLLGGIKIALPH